MNCLDRNLLFALLILLGHCGCAGVTTMISLENEELRKSINNNPIKYKLVIAPLKIRYKVKPFGAEGAPDSAEKNAEQPSALRAIASYQPMLRDDEKAAMQALIEETLKLSFGKDNLEVIGEEPSDAGAAMSDTALFHEAEARGAELLLKVEVTENRLNYLGVDRIGQFWDTVLFFGAPPFHIYWDDEIFESQRTLTLEFYDVREGLLERYQVISTVEQKLDEPDHGYIFFNSLRAWGSNPDRFQLENWQKVYEGFRPSRDKDLQNKLIKKIDREFRRVLQSPKYEDDLTRGDPKTARLYAVIVGQNNGSCQFAEADVKRLSDVLLATNSLVKKHLFATISKVKKKTIIDNIGKLRTKAVDRVLFYFSGQGRQTKKGELELVLDKDKSLSIKDLAFAFREVRAENIAFVIDSSFNDPTPGEDVGSRTHRDSLKSSTPKEKYLNELISSKRGWQLLCAASNGEVSGEYAKAGMFSGLLLKRLEKAKDDVSLKGLVQFIAEPLRERGKGRLGKAITPFFRPLEGKKTFLLIGRAKDNRKNDKKDQ
jgi:hypothetical protein